MLRYWELHEDYQRKLLLNLKSLSLTEKSRVVSMDKSLSKLYLLNLDNLLPVIKHLYSDTGRPATNQQGIIRSLVLMLESKKHSIINWAKKVAYDRLLCAACGFEFGAMDNYATYRLLHKWNMIPFIPLDSNARIDYVKPHPGILCFDDDGNPICIGGIPYQHVGFSFPKGIKYRCWFDYHGILNLYYVYSP